MPDVGLSTLVHLRLRQEFLIQGSFNISVSTVESNSSRNSASSLEFRKTVLHFTMSKNRFRNYHKYYP